MIAQLAKGNVSTIDSFLMDQENTSLTSMNLDEMDNINGGFIPLVVYGVVIGAEYVAALFLAGVGVGAAVAQGQK